MHYKTAPDIQHSTDKKFPISPESKRFFAVQEQSIFYFCRSSLLLTISGSLSIILSVCYDGTRLNAAAVLSLCITAFSILLILIISVVKVFFPNIQDGYYLRFLNILVNLLNLSEVEDDKKNS